MTAVSTPTGTNAAAGVGNQVVSGVVNVGVTVAETLLFADYPFLAVPVIKPLVQLAINFVSGYVIKGLSQFVTFAIIDVQVGTEETAYGKALAALKTAQTSGDTIAIYTALGNFQAAVQNLSHSDGSAAL